MSSILEFRNVTKRYDDVVALNDVTLSIARASIVGLIGRNGSGKTTLLRHATGLVLPSSGDCITLGQRAAQLTHRELARIGVVEQKATLIPWMRGEQLIRYVSSFYEKWDRALERELVDKLEVQTHARVGTLSPGNAQRLSVVLAACHHPELLLLDEPLSDLDPTARQTLLALLLERFSNDGMTIVISSHLLHDLEPVVNHIVCMHRGRVAADDELDALSERYAEWIATSPSGMLSGKFHEHYVVSAEGNAQRSRLVVRANEADLVAFQARYGATVETRALSLEKIFPLLTSNASTWEAV